MSKSVSIRVKFIRNSKNERDDTGSCFLGVILLGGRCPKTAFGNTLSFNILTINIAQLFKHT